LDSLALEISRGKSGRADLHPESAVSQYPLADSVP
jgi:hypothetical protein